MAYALPTSLRRHADTALTGSMLRPCLAIDTNARLMAFVQTWAGRCTLLATMLVLGKLVGVSLLVLLAAAACAWSPRHRPWLILGATLLVLVRQPAWFGADAIHTVLQQEGLAADLATPLIASTLMGWFTLAAGVLAQARRHPTAWMVRRPVLTLLALQACLLAMACSPWLVGTARAGVWTCLAANGAYLWFTAYALIDQRSRPAGPILPALGLFHPFWGSTATPYGKGAAFLRKHEAHTAQELAVTQIKALKLLAWSGMLMLLDETLRRLIEGHLQVPTPAWALAEYLQGRPIPIVLSWCGLVWATAHHLLAFAVFGHQIIAVARLAGWRLPRNTWRPLQSRTMADFWNRNYYYFKEMLVDLFFFPTFVRMFKKHPRLRVFFATFMAAGVGNALYHFLRDIHVVASLGLWGAMVSYTSYLFYCTVLALGIAASQARASEGHRPTPGLIGCIRSGVCIWPFVVCLHIFADESRIYSLGERLLFMASLFGASP